MTWLRDVRQRYRGLFLLAGLVVLEIWAIQSCDASAERAGMFMPPSTTVSYPMIVPPEPTDQIGLLKLENSPPYDFSRHSFGATLRASVSLDATHTLQLIETEGTCCIATGGAPICYLWWTAPSGHYVEKLDACPIKP